MCYLPVSVYDFVIFPAHFRHHLLHIMAQGGGAKGSGLCVHTRICTQHFLKQPKFDFKVSLLEPLVCLVNQTLFCLVSQPGWLAGCREAPGGTTEGKKTHTYTHTHTLPSFKQLQMALIPCPLSFTIYQVTHSERACLLFMLCWDDLTLLRFVRRRGKKKSRTALINVVRLTSVAAETISLHHQFKLPRRETLEGAPIQKPIYTLS